MMEAVYFSTGLFAEAVDRVRNNATLWPHRNARQAGNTEERQREWEGMMVEWRRQRVEDALRAKELEDSEGELLEDLAAGESESKAQMRVTEAKQEVSEGEVKAAKEKTQGKESIRTQSTWIEMQQLLVEGNIEKLAEEAEEVKVEPETLAGVMQVQRLVVQEKRRTAVDIFESEASKASTEW